MSSHDLLSSSRVAHWLPSLTSVCIFENHVSHIGCPSLNSGLIFVEPKYHFVSHRVDATQFNHPLVEYFWSHKGYPDLGFVCSFGRSRVVLWSQYNDPESYFSRPCCELCMYIGWYVWSILGITLDVMESWSHDLITVGLVF